MTQITGMNLMDFYLGWIHQPGFLHYSIDSIVPTATPNHYNVHFRQRLHHAVNYANSNHVDVKFVSATGESYIVEKMNFNGATDVTPTYIPFQPAFYIIDPNEKLGDALFDYYVNIVNTNSVTCTDAYIRFKDDLFTDTTSIYAAYNLVTPDPLKNPCDDIFRISNTHFWSVEFLENHISQGAIHFRYLSSLPTSKDYELMQGYTKDDLLLLYRRNAGQDWIQIPFTVAGSNIQGYLITNHVLPGEYVLAVGNYAVGVQNSNASNLEIYPSPATDHFYLKLSDFDLTNVPIQIFNMEGKMVYNTTIVDPSQRIDVSNLSPGNYIVKVIHNNKIENAKLMIIK